MHSQTLVSVSGAGIAGLVTAIALRKIGINCTIYEAADEIKPLGAGLVLAANAIKGFKKLGDEIEKKIIAKGRLLASFAILSKSGRVISRTDSKAIGNKFGTDNFTIHRAALHEALLSLIDTSLIKTGKRVISAEDTGYRVNIHFADGKYAHSEYLIAADGIHSSVRKHLLPESTIRYAGYNSWRAVIDGSGLNLSESTETWGKDGRFGIVPLAENKIYWFASVTAKQNDPVFHKYKVKDIKQLFSGYHKNVTDVLNNTNDDQLLLNDIIDLKPVDNYAFGRIVLIGDAAHATTPNMGQGACQAIEDAVILAEEISISENIENAFKKFEARRIKRTHFIVNGSWRLGKLAQASNPIVSTFRNLSLRLMPDSIKENQLKKLYNVDF